MISIFGAVSLVILLVCVAALIILAKLINLRGAVDDNMTHLDKAPAEERDTAVTLYNNSVNTYNVKISTFPGKLVAPLVGFEEINPADAPH